jgi:hypothetical protein
MSTRPKTKTGKRRSRVIVWGASVNVVCAHLINNGFHARTISAATGLSKSQVYYRARRLGLRLRDYRNGKGPIAATTLRRFAVRRINTKDRCELQSNLWPVMQRRLQERQG